MREKREEYRWPKWDTDLYEGESATAVAAWISGGQVGAANPPWDIEIRPGTPPYVVLLGEHIHASKSRTRSRSRTATATTSRTRTRSRTETTSRTRTRSRTATRSASATTTTSKSATTSHSTTTSPIVPPYDCCCDCSVAAPGAPGGQISRACFFSSPCEDPLCVDDTGVCYYDETIKRRVAAVTKLSGTDCDDLGVGLNVVYDYIGLNTCVPA